MDKVAQQIRRSMRGFISLAKILPQEKGSLFKPMDVLLINNSFVYRDKNAIKTTKSDLYLSVHVTGGGKFSNSPRIATGMAINSDHKRIPESAVGKLTLIPLNESLEAQLRSLGNLLFVLIGHIDDTTVNRQVIQHADYKELIWDPSSKVPVDLSAPIITVADARSEAVIWADIEKEFGRHQTDIPDGLRNAFAISIEKLKDEAVANLILPSLGSPKGSKLTELFVQVFQEQRDEYAAALTGSRKQGEVSNEILRIAYNFASDAITLVRLIVSICDLKPVVLWGTLDKHFALAQSLQNLPWHRRVKKPGLNSYRSTIADARNSAFHSLFPFRKALDVELPEDSLREAKMRIFSYYTKKSQNVLLYQDKELADLLFEFSRPREREVSLQFWERNLDVMDATIELCDATGGFLSKLLVAESNLGLA